MMLEPPESLAASYRLVPLMDTDMVMVLSEWSKESSWGGKGTRSVTETELYTKSK